MTSSLSCKFYDLPSSVNVNSWGDQNFQQETCLTFALCKLVQFSSPYKTQSQLFSCFRFKGHETLLISNTLRVVGVTIYSRTVQLNSKENLTWNSIQHSFFSSTLPWKGNFLVYFFIQISEKKKKKKKKSHKEIWILCFQSIEKLVCWQFEPLMGR